MTTTPAPTDLDSIRKHIQLAEDWAEYGHVGDPNWHVARTLIKQVPALLDELDKTRAELDKVRAELEQATQQRNNFRDLAIQINQVRGEANPATTAEPANEDAEDAPCKTCGKPWRNRRHECQAEPADEPKAKPAAPIGPGGQPCSVCETNGMTCLDEMNRTGTRCCYACGLADVHNVAAPEPAAS